jgi:phage terminase large subunit-like protein
MIDGPSGLLSCYPRDDRPVYEPSKGYITWGNGALARAYSAEEPNRLRGPACECVWGDEIAAWKPQTAVDTWDNMAFGLRMGTDPRGVFTSTPKPVPLFQQLVKDPHTVITRASSYENRSNLAPGFFADIIKKYEGTRLGRQELMAELLEDIPGALWTQQLIDAGKINLQEVIWELITRIVIAIDPAVSHGEDSDETGIIVAGLTRSEHVIVIDDLTCRESPLGWARIAVAAYRSRRADRIVGEVNNGGELVEANLRAVAPDVAYRAVRASRGKAIRAEPVAALYEQGRVHHIRYGDATGNRFDQLEDQMTHFVPGVTTKSPDRLDALVWAITELVIDREEISRTLLQPLVRISPI